MGLLSLNWLLQGIRIVYYAYIVLCLPFSSSLSVTTSLSLSLFAAEIVVSARKGLLHAFGSVVCQFVAAANPRGHFVLLPDCVMHTHTCQECVYVCVSSWGSRAESVCA